jgi:TldD protein
MELAMEALNAARDAGASYADVRIGRYRRQSINTRERQVSGVSDSESYGLGVRTLVDGCWGFAATSTMTRAGAQNAAREAAGLSRAARAVHMIRSRCRSRRRSRSCWPPTRRRSRSRTSGS